MTESIFDAARRILGGEVCDCCERAGLPAKPNVDSSEWECDCHCHFGWQREFEDKIAQLTEENALLRCKIENHIIMTESFQKDYNSWLDTLKGDDDGR